MPQSDPFETQRDVVTDAVTELNVAGFADAQEIGRGGFGVVYRCTQAALDRTVAVKVLTGELDENRDRFFREQRAMGRLTGHPNIVGVLQAGETESGHPYLVMQYHRQGCLETRIRHNGPLSAEEVMRLGVRMAGALTTAHRAGVIHRDVKPANILFTDYGQSALTDFGIAHIADGFRTATGTVTGSPAFTAPEVLGGDAPSSASDVYGLGATLFCALTGHAAFERRSGEQVMAQFLRITSLPAPDLSRSGIPADLSAVIAAAMSREPGDRPTAVGLGEQLQRLQVSHNFAVEDMALRAEAGAESELERKAVSTGRHQDGGLFPDSVSGEIGNLPLELTSFVGRRTQVSEVKNLLAGSRLVTLTGIGGVGKTRLALQVASKLRQDYPGGAWLIELGELRDATSLADVVAATLRLGNQAGRPMLEVLVNHLSARELLLVLDNCEQLVDAVAELVQSLLRACPHLHILATSREGLGIGGESVFALAPLEFPDPATEPSLRALARYDAVALFARRAAAAVPGFELTERNRLDVARICARLDGLPLAIELAAARLNTMSAHQILTRLDNRYGLLTRGSRDAPTRQQTLRWCIGWSYDLCTPDEQGLWERLSVFAASFELDAAQDICGPEMSEMELLDLLSALVDKSILNREETNGVVRFRFLETVEEYGRDKIQEKGEYLELYRRHQNWYARLARTAEAEWVSPRQLDWIARLERELPNLRKALDFALTQADDHALQIAAPLYTFWALRDRLSEGRRWIDRALAHSSDRPPADRARALYGAMLLATIENDLPAASGRAAELRTLATQNADPMIGVAAGLAEGYAAFVSGDPVRAIPFLEEARDALAEGDELQWHIGVLMSLGWAYELLDDLPRALASHEQALELTESHGETATRGYASWGVGVAMWRQGECDRAIQLLRQGLRLARLLHDPYTAATCSESLAWVAADQNEMRRAAVLLGAADAQCHIAGSNFTVIFINMLVYHDECERRTREVLGAKAYEAARNEGAAMSFRAAIRFALDEPDPTAERADEPAADLTNREHQVARLIAEGLSNKDIAARLVISTRTAQSHVEHILTKLGFGSRVQIAAWVIEHTRDQPT